MIVLVNYSYDIISAELNAYSPPYIIFFLSQSRTAIRSTKYGKLRIWRRLISIYYLVSTSPQDYDDLYLL
jgi:hypothetical protein